jgi:hypothetical protein
MLQTLLMRLADRREAEASLISLINLGILLAKWSGWLEVDTYAGSCPG